VAFNRTVRIRDKNDIPKFEARLREADGVTLEIGFPGKDQEGKTLAGIASTNEFGTLHIPSRSFLRTTFDAKETQKKLDRTLKALMTLPGESRSVENLTEALGVTMVAEIRKKIRSNIAPPNALRTVNRKKSARTLIDTGRMLQGVDYALKGI